MAALLAVEPAREEHERVLAEQRAADAELRAADEAARAEQVSRTRKRDGGLILVTLVALASVYGPALLGRVLSSSGPLADPGTAVLRTAGHPVPLFNIGYLSTGAIVILLSGAMLLAVRFRVRETPVGASFLAAFVLGAVALLILLPSLRDRAWESNLAKLAVPNANAPCTPSSGAAYLLSTGTLQPVVVGSPPSCQLVWRVAGRRGEVAWAKWVPRIHVLRVHRFSDRLVVGGTYGGRRVSASGSNRTKGSRLIIAGLAPRTGRELWRRACPAPPDGERGILFHTRGAAKNGIRQYVRLRCGDGRLLFFRQDGRAFAKPRGKRARTS